MSKKRLSGSRESFAPAPPASKPVTLPLTAVALVHRDTPDDARPWYVDGPELPAYIAIMRAQPGGLRALRDELPRYLNGIAEILSDFSVADDAATSDALAALAYLQTHLLAVLEHSAESADGWTVEPRLDDAALLGVVTRDEARS